MEQSRELRFGSVSLVMKISLNRPRNILLILRCPIGGGEARIFVVHTYLLGIEP